MKTHLLSVALAGAFALLYAGDAAAQNSSAESFTGARKSDKLIQFENALDALELGFADALAKGGDEDYESKLEGFEALSCALQKEAVKAGLLSFVELRCDAIVISDTYCRMKDALSKGERVPILKLVSTRRHNRADGPGSPENWAEFKCEASLDSYYAPYDDIESPGLSKVSPPEMLESIRNLRQMTGWLERDGRWLAVPNNGKTFVLSEAPESGAIAYKGDSQDSQKPKQTHKKIEFFKEWRSSR